MKKFLSLILILIIFTVPVSVVAFAEDEEPEQPAEEQQQEQTDGVFLFDSASYESKLGYEFDLSWGMDYLLEYFVTNFPDRCCGDLGERDAAQYLADVFTTFVDNYGFKNGSVNKDGTATNGSIFQPFSFTAGDGTSYTSKNVIVTKPAMPGTQSPKTVIIGAHYDNAYDLPSGTDESSYGFQGAYDNGTGVAILINLMESLKDVNLDYNITFIAFGAGEFAMQGSQYYADNMLISKDDVLLMINLNMIGAGDYLYLYCDQVSTQHQNFLFDIAAKNNINLNAAPFDKHLNTYAAINIPYSHIGLTSDNLPFLQKGINCAFFFTYNWAYGLSESANQPSILYTANDNIDTLKKVDQSDPTYYLTYMTNVSNIIINALNASDFESTMSMSAASKFDYSIFLNRWFLLGVGFGVLILAGVLVYFAYKKFKREKTEEVKPIVEPIEKIAVFGDDFEDKNN